MKVLTKGLVVNTYIYTVRAVNSVGAYSVASKGVEVILIGDDKKVVPSSPTKLVIKF